jgi:hypothetical protein
VPSLDLLEVPRDEELAGRRDNTRLIDIITVIELGRCKVNEFDLILHDISGVNSQLDGLRLVLRDRFSETRDTVIVLSRENKDVSLASGQYPLLVLTYIDRLNWLTQTRKHCFGDLTHLLVHSDISIGRSNNEPTIEVSSNRIKHYISLVSLRVDYIVISKSGIKLMQSLSLNAIEGP